MKKEQFIHIDREGNRSYYSDREMKILHREDGPAVEYADGGKEWYINGKLHREDGPAIEYADGDKEWYIDDKRHREDGPAVECADGDKAWYIDDKCHREDGPAVEYTNGRKAWFINGKLHREDGPAVEYANGGKEWYLNGKELTEEEFNARMKPETEVPTGDRMGYYKDSSGEWKENGIGMGWCKSCGAKIRFCTCSEARQGLTCSDLLSLQGLLGGHGIWTPELEKELVDWINSRPREVICTKCGIREQKGEKPKADF